MKWLGNVSLIVGLIRAGIWLPRHFLVCIGLGDNSPCRLLIGVSWDGNRTVTDAKIVESILPNWEDGRFLQRLRSSAQRVSNQSARLCSVTFAQLERVIDGKKEARNKPPAPPCWSVLAFCLLGHGGGIIDLCRQLKFKTNLWFRTLLYFITCNYHVLGTTFMKRKH